MFQIQFGLLPEQAADPLNPLSALEPRTGIDFAAFAPPTAKPDSGVIPFVGHLIGGLIDEIAADFVGATKTIGAAAFFPLDALGAAVPITIDDLTTRDLKGAAMAGAMVAGFGAAKVFSAARAAQEAAAVYGAWGRLAHTAGIEAVAGATYGLTRPLEADEDRAEAALKDIGLFAAGGTVFHGAGIMMKVAAQRTLGGVVAAQRQRIGRLFLATSAARLDEELFVREFAGTRLLGADGSIKSIRRDAANPKRIVSTYRPTTGKATKEFFTTFNDALTDAIGSGHRVPLGPERDILTQKALMRFDQEALDRITTDGITIQERLRGVQFNEYQALREARLEFSRAQTEFEVLAADVALPGDEFGIVKFTAQERAALRKQLGPTSNKLSDPELARQGIIQGVFSMQDAQGAVVTKQYLRDLFFNGQVPVGEAKLNYLVNHNEDLFLRHVLTPGSIAKIWPAVQPAVAMGDAAVQVLNDNIRKAGARLTMLRSLGPAALFKKAQESIHNAGLPMNIQELFARAGGADLGAVAGSADNVLNTMGRRPLAVRTHHRGPKLEAELRKEYRIRKSTGDIDAVSAAMTEDQYVTQGLTFAEKMNQVSGRGIAALDAHPKLSKLKGLDERGEPFTAGSALNEMTSGTGFGPAFAPSGLSENLADFPTSAEALEILQNSYPTEILRFLVTFGREGGKETIETLESLVSDQQVIGGIETVLFTVAQHLRNLGINPADYAELRQVIVDASKEAWIASGLPVKRVLWRGETQAQGTEGVARIRQRFETNRALMGTEGLEFAVPVPAASGSLDPRGAALFAKQGMSDPGFLGRNEADQLSRTLNMAVVDVDDVEVFSNAFRDPRHQFSHEQEILFSPDVGTRGDIIPIGKHDSPKTLARKLADKLGLEISPDVSPGDQFRRGSMGLTTGVRRKLSATRARLDQLDENITARIIEEDELERGITAELNHIDQIRQDLTIGSTERQRRIQRSRELIAQAEDVLASMIRPELQSMRAELGTLLRTEIPEQLASALKMSVADVEANGSLSIARQFVEKGTTMFDAPGFKLNEEIQFVPDFELAERQALHDALYRGGPELHRITKATIEMLKDYRTRLTEAGVLREGIPGFFPIVNSNNWRIGVVTKEGKEEFRGFVGTLGDAFDEIQRIVDNEEVIRTSIVPRTVTTSGEELVTMDPRQFGAVVRALAEAGEFENNSQIREFADRFFRVTRNKGKRKFFPHAQKRSLGVFDYAREPLDALESYVNAAERAMALRDVDRFFTAEAEKIPAVQSNLKEWLLQLRDDILGRPRRVELAFDAVADRLGLSEVLPSRALKAYSAAIRKWEAFARLGGFWSGIVNLTQFTVNTVPVLGAKWSGVAIADMMQPKNWRTIVDTLQKVGVEEIEMFMPLSREGEAILQGSVREAFKDRRYIESFHRMALWMFNGAEKVNRVGTAWGAYKRAMAEMRGKGISLEVMQQRAGRAANEIVKRTQFNYRLTNMPEILRGPVGATLFQFKSFLINEIEFIASLRGKEIPRFVGAVWAIGGLSLMMNMPGPGLVDAAGRLFFDQSLTETLRLAGKDRDARGRELAKDLAVNTTLFGAPGFFFKVDVSDYVGLGNLRDIQRGLIGPGAKDIANLGKFILNGAEEYISLGRVSQETKARAMQQLLPSALRRADMARRVFTNNEIRDPYKGKKLYQPYNRVTSAIAFGLGAPPIRFQQEKAAEAITARVVDRYRKAHSEFAKDAARHIIQGEPQEVARIKAEAAEAGILLDDRAVKYQLRELQEPAGVRRLRRTPRQRRERVAEAFQALGQPPADEALQRALVEGDRDRINAAREALGLIQLPSEPVQPARIQFGP